MNKHAPAPWRIKNGEVTAADGRIVRIRGVQLAFQDNRDHGEATANAQLIAAAPDLLAACEALLLAAKTQNINQVYDATDMARAAIDKARG